jgi:hypothetical protein
LAAVRCLADPEHEPVHGARAEPLDAAASLHRGHTFTRRLAQIPQTSERGHRLAIAGIIIGVVTLIFAIGYWVFVAMHTGAGGGSGGGGGGGY